jgi:CRISPR/Cas system-associated exonuclease Cas4 (RecB family)
MRHCLHGTKFLFCPVGQWLKMTHTVMTNTNRPPEQDPEFTNDKLTDLVLHKDDEPIVENGEIINEPEDVEEQSADAAKKPCWFPIHFSYKDIHYTADVEKRLTPFAEYRVTAINPSISHLPDPYVVAEHFTKEKFDYPVNEEFYPHELGEIIIKAIGEGCLEMGYHF